MLHPHPTSLEDRYVRIPKYAYSMPMRQTVVELIQLVPHLSPHYTDTFQDPHMVKFLTYEASTSESLNMCLILKSNIPLLKIKPGKHTSIAKCLV